MRLPGNRPGAFFVATSPSDDLVLPVCGVLGAGRVVGFRLGGHEGRLTVHRAAGSWPLGAWKGRPEPQDGLRGSHVGPPGFRVAGNRSRPAAKRNGKSPLVTTNRNNEARGRIGRAVCQPGGHRQSAHLPSAACHISQRCCRPARAPCPSCPRRWWPSRSSRLRRRFLQSRRSRSCPAARPGPRAPPAWRGCSACRHR